MENKIECVRCRNIQCGYFPCHKDADAENFSCTFCYCPLYPLKDCGGSYTCDKNGIKDCSACTFPHDPANHGAIVEKSEKAFRAVLRERRRKKRHAIASMLIAVLLGALTAFLPVVLLQNLWRITEMLDIPEATQVIAQLRDVNFAPAYLIAAACALVCGIIMLRLRRNKIIAALLVILVFVPAVIAALVFTESSGVPVYTIVQILIEYVQSGAF